MQKKLKIICIILGILCFVCFLPNIIWNIRIKILDLKLSNIDIPVENQFVWAEGELSVGFYKFAVKTPKL